MSNKQQNGRPSTPGTVPKDGLMALCVNPTPNSPLGNLGAVPPNNPSGGVAAFAEAYMGISLTPWQKDVLKRMDAKARQDKLRATAQLTNRVMFEMPARRMGRAFGVTLEELETLKKSTARGLKKIRVNDRFYDLLRLSALRDHGHRGADPSQQMGSFAGITVEVDEAVDRYEIHNSDGTIDGPPKPTPPIKPTRPSVAYYDELGDPEFFHNLFMNKD